MKVKSIKTFLEEYEVCSRCGSDTIIGMLVFDNSFLMTCICGRKIEINPKKVVVAKGFEE